MKKQAWLYPIVGLTVLVVVLTVGCRHNTRAVRAGSYASLDMSFPSYVHFAVEAELAQSTKIEFPFLLIFDRSGNLTYAEHDASRNVDLLSSLSKGEPAVHNVGQTVKLQTMMNAISNLDSKYSDLTKSELPTVVAVSLDSCEACTLQEGSLSGNKTNLLNAGFNVLDIKVSRSGRGS